MIIINQQLENICLILIWVEELDYELLVKHNHDNSYAHSVTDVHTQKQKLEHFFSSINDMKCIKFTETARQRKRIRLIFFHRMEWFSWCYIQILNNMTKDRDSQKMILIYMKRGKTGMLRGNCHKKVVSPAMGSTIERKREMREECWKFSLKYQREKWNNERAVVASIIRIRRP